MERRELEGLLVDVAEGRVSPEDAAMQPEEPDAQPNSGEEAPAGNAEEVGAGV